MTDREEIIQELQDIIKYNLPPLSSIEAIVERYKNKSMEHKEIEIREKIKIRKI